MGLVDLDAGPVYRLVFHDNRQHFVGQSFQQGKPVAVDMVDDLLGDGAVIERGGDLVLFDGFGGIVGQANVDHHILLVADLFILDDDVGAQQQVFDPYAGQVVAGYVFHGGSCRT